MRTNEIRVTIEALGGIEGRVLRTEVVLLDPEDLIIGDVEQVLDDMVSEDDDD